MVEVDGQEYTVPANRFGCIALLNDGSDGPALGFTGSNSDGVEFAADWSRDSPESTVVSFILDGTEYTNSPAGAEVEVEVPERGRGSIVATLLGYGDSGGFIEVDVNAELTC